MANFVVTDIANPLQTTSAYAGFGQATLNLFDSLHITLGARYSDDSKSSTSFTHFGPPPGPGDPPFAPPFHGSGSWSRLTYKANVSYDVTPTSLAYATISTGFKSGGFAYGSQSSNGLTPRYNPETITAYELGSKNRFFGNRLQINLEAFDYQYKNFEVLYFAPGTYAGRTFFTLFATNAGTAQVYGAGLTADFALTADDRVSANVQYLHAQYGQYDLSYINQPNYSGSTFPNAPKWQGQASYDHTFHIGGSTVDARGDLQYGGKRNELLSPRPATTDFPAIYQDAYATADISLTYTPPGGKWTATAYVHNVSDTTYTNQVSYAAPGVFESLNDPRVVGIILGAHF